MLPKCCTKGENGTDKNIGSESRVRVEECRKLHNSEFHCYSSPNTIRIIIRKLWDEQVLWHAKDRQIHAAGVLVVQH